MPSWGPTRWGGACAVKRFGEAKTLKSAEFTSDDLSENRGLLKIRNLEGDLWMGKDFRVPRCGLFP